MKKSTVCLLTGSLALLATALPASAVTISNGIPLGTLGHWDVDVWTGGESRHATLTARRADNTLTNQDVLYDYYTYVNVGGGGVRLGNESSATLNGTGQAVSSGSFTGSAGNTINWTATSSIPANSGVMTTQYTFAAATGDLGDLRLFQYLDEDVENFSDDILFTRGSIAGDNLQLFTIDNPQRYGVAQSGGFSGSQGLMDASFVGWAACTYDSMRPAIANGTQTVSPSGVICSGLPSFNDPTLGLVYGPRDVVSVMAWDVNSNATAATIVTSLGGIPSSQDIPSAPEPATLALFGIGLAGLAGLRRRNG